MIRLQHMDAPRASRSLASTYGLGVTEARRDMETVQNWLPFLTPEILLGTPCAGTMLPSDRGSVWLRPPDNWGYSAAWFTAAEGATTSS